MHRTHASALAGLLVLASSIAAQPPTPAGKGQPTTVTAYPPSLYQMNDVSKSLNLTADQIARLNKLTDQTQAQYRGDYTKLGTLNDADRFARTQELHRQYYNDWYKGANDVLNDAQRARYQQLNHQYGGFNSLYDPEVQKRLNLTPEQVKELRTHSDWDTQQLQEVNRIGTNDATRGTQTYRDYLAARQARFNKFLTAEQQKAWSQMTGEPYTFQPTFTPQR